MKPLVSIIIPTKNSSRTIENTLLSMKKQTYSPIEIIVVDNFSSDGTFEIAQKHADKAFQIGPERTEQKNKGILASEGEFLLLIDGDMTADVELINDCVRLITEQGEKGGGVCIPVVDTGKSFWVKVIALERSFYKDTAIEAARFLKKNLVETVGMYKNIIFYEEFIVPQEIGKLGFNVKLHTEFNLYHDHDDFSFWKNLKKKFYYGKTLKYYKESIQKLGLGEVSSEQLGILGRYAIFLRDKRFYSTPLLSTGILLLKTLEFGAGACGYMYTLILGNHAK